MIEPRCETIFPDRARDTPHRIAETQRKRQNRVHLRSPACAKPALRLGEGRSVPHIQRRDRMPASPRLGEAFGQALAGGGQGLVLGGENLAA